MTTPKFSVVLIARNGTKTLPRLFASLADFKAHGGEIVIVDNGSTDNTVEFARSFGCVVHEERVDKFYHITSADTAGAINALFVAGSDPQVIKEGDIVFNSSAARNYAVSKCSNDWVAMPDCDEVLTVLDVEALNQRISQGNASRLEYEFVQAHDQAGEPTMQFRQTKFYDRTKYHWSPESFIHEVIVPIGTDNSAPLYVGPSFLKVDHWQDLQVNRSHNLGALSMLCYLSPRNARNSHYFARELFYARRYASAIREFNRHITMNDWLTERAQSEIYKGDCFMGLGHIKDALNSWNQAFLLDGTRREPLMRLARYFYGRGDHHKTAAYAAAALAIPRQGNYMENEDNYRQGPHELLYVSLWHLGDRRESKYHWKQAIDYQPKNPKFLHDGQFYV
jgi:glycosyltransferase involved in cell wall biosynthesis